MGGGRSRGDVLCAKSEPRTSAGLVWDLGSGKPSAASVSARSAGPPDGSDTGSTKKEVDSLNAFYSP